MADLLQPELITDRAEIDWSDQVLMANWVLLVTI